MTISSLGRGARPVGPLAMVALLAAGAFTSAAHAQSASSWSKRGTDAEQRQDYDAAFEAYRQAYLLKPKDLRFRTHFERMRFSASAAHMDRGRVLRQSGDLNGALSEFQRALAIDGSNQAAQQEILLTTREMDAAPSSLNSLPAPAGPRAEVASVSGPLQLKPVSNERITLHSVADTKELYQAIGKLAGLNVIFDPDYTSRRIELDLKAVSLADALRILGTQAATFYKPVTENTIFVAANTRAKRTDLDSVAVQTFYLSNAATQADQNELLTALRQVLDPTVKIFLVPSQNALVVRATPDELTLVESLLNNLDRARSEVVVDVAVLEVNRDKMRILGITLPQQFSVTPQISNAVAAAAPGTNPVTGGAVTTNTTTQNLTLNSLAHLNGTNFAVTLGTATANALLNDTDTRILQNPRVRATDGRRAQLKIGQRIPIATGSFSSGVSTAVVSSLVNTQFTYIDVGVTIDLTPTVHLDREVGLKMKIEISSQTGSVTISGVQQPIIAQRTIDQEIQLKEGEPSILAGLLQRSEADVLTGTPGLAQIPGLKHIFSSTNRDRAQDEVVFLLIPHIVREPIVTRMNTRAIDTGTGAGIELRREPVADAAALGDTAAAAAAIPSGAAQPKRPVSNTTAADAASAMIGQIGNEGSRSAAQAAAQSLPSQTDAAAKNAAVAGATAGDSETVNFTVAPGNLNQVVGGTFQMAVNVANARDLYSAPLQVQFNPQVLSLVNVDSGDLLGRDGQAVAVVHRDEGNGLATISVSRPPAVAGISGQGSICVLTFKANAPGDSSVSLVRVGAKNSAQANLPAVGSQATVHVK